MYLFLKQALLRRRPSGKCLKKIARSHWAKLVFEGGTGVLVTDIWTTVVWTTVVWTTLSGLLPSGLLSSGLLLSGLLSSWLRISDLLTDWLTTLTYWLRNNRFTGRTDGRMDFLASIGSSFEGHSRFQTTFWQLFVFWSSKIGTQLLPHQLQNFEKWMAFLLAVYPWLMFPSQGGSDLVSGE